MNKSSLDLYWKKKTALFITKCDCTVELNFDWDSEYQCRHDMESCTSCCERVEC